MSRTQSLLFLCNLYKVPINLADIALNWTYLYYFCLAPQLFMVTCQWGDDMIRHWSATVHRSWATFGHNASEHTTTASHSINLSPVHSSTPSNHCLAGLPRDLFPSALPGKMVFARVPFDVTTCPHHLSFLTISCGVSYFRMCSAILLKA